VLTMDANATLDTIAVGGEFTAFGGHDRPHFAQFSTSCVYGCGPGREPAPHRRARAEA